jgi:pantetheine-phosphate adenylyltransferase
MPKTARVAICPGTFDPITYGHMDIIERGLKIFDKVIVAVAESDSKGPIFTVDERLDMIRKTVGRKPKVQVESFRGLVVDFAKKRGAGCLLRGVRMLSDFEYEFQMALTNRKLSPDVETIFLMPNESYAYLTSRLIKEISTMGGDVRTYVPPYVFKKLKERFNF